MKIYEVEKKLGLESKIIAGSKASAPMGIDIKNQKDILEKIKAANLFRDGEKQYMQDSLNKDLMCAYGILVSTNWNLNDDVFSPTETWAARSTPIYKPANIGHIGSEEAKANNTIGVITRAYPVDDSYDYISPTYDGDNVIPPDNFNILVSMMLWEKYFPTAVAAIKQGIDENKMSISMECLFSDFGYALKKTDSTDVITLDRNEITAWLSANLKAFDGPGTVTINNQQYQIGRLVKNITFSGVGFVTVPANPKSIVFNDYISHAQKNKLKIIPTTTNLNNFSKSSVLDFSKELVSLWL